jgi:hypothetical protein
MVTFVLLILRPCVPSLFFQDRLKVTHQLTRRCAASSRTLENGPPQTRRQQKLHPKELLAIVEDRGELQTRVIAPAPVTAPQETTTTETSQLNDLTSTEPTFTGTYGNPRHGTHPHGTHGIHGTHAYGTHAYGTHAYGTHAYGTHAYGTHRTTRPNIHGTHRTT